MAKRTDQNDKKYYRVNEKIRFSPVMVVDQDGQNLGALPVDKAKQLAKSAKLDLVEVAPHARPPVCRIMDFGKFKYDQSIKEKKQRGKSKTNQPKEVRLSPRIADHDIETKSKAIKKFIEAGFKVQVKLEYKKRENAHKNLGFAVMEKVLAHLEEVAAPKDPPKLQGRFLMCMLEPKK
jgi:translation initiation factor IF-3